ncbi:hypothetical protein C8J57DRAFT_1421989 [Mycena rebaudengoi]|nr:hypothetical protein C8J57DRAFT_1421989 [Mycena rebaudengoi]
MLFRRVLGVPELIIVSVPCTLFPFAFPFPTMERPENTPFDDESGCRASIYDVFVELGALDLNSRVAEWMFSDPGSELPDLDYAVPLDDSKSVDKEMEVGHGMQGTGIDVEKGTQSHHKTSRLRPPSSSKSFRLQFSPMRIRRTPKKAYSTTPPPNSPSCDGNEIERHTLASPDSTTTHKSRVRTVFSLSSTKPSPAHLAKPMPPNPEKLRRTESSSSLAKAISLFRKKRKVSDTQTATTLDRRHHAGRALDGELLAPSSFRPIGSPTAHAGHNSPAHPSFTFPLPRTLFRSISLTKRKNVRPPSLILVHDDPESRRRASSLPSSPFILMAKVEGGGSASAGPNTPFVFVSPVENTSSLNSARRFSDITSMTGPIYPLSLRRSMILDNTEPSFPKSSSYPSLQDPLSASAASSSHLYDQPIPSIRRGREVPFPIHPVLPYPLSHNSPHESRSATIQRYREFSEQLVELTTHKRAATREY